MSEGVLLMQGLQFYYHWLGGVWLTQEYSEEYFHLGDVCVQGNLVGVVKGCVGYYSWVVEEDGLVVVLPLCMTDVDKDEEEEEVLGWYVYVVLCHACFSGW